MVGTPTSLRRACGAGTVMPVAHVSFTGTRVGMTQEQHTLAERLLCAHEVKILTHGDCIGADAQAHALALRLGLRVRKRPSNLPTRAFTEGGELVAEPTDPLVRNRLIVDDGEVLIACPKEAANVLRSGTWAAVRYARKVRRTVWLVLPDGRLVP